jgi:hypothetical protein
MNGLLTDTERKIIMVELADSNSKLNHAISMVIKSSFEICANPDDYDLVVEFQKLCAFASSEMQSICCVVEDVRHFLKSVEGRDGQRALCDDAVLKAGDW